jgi:hypothetical protein
MIKSHKSGFKSIKIWLFSLVLVTFEAVEEFTKGVMWKEKYN